ncbi:MAG: DUF6250 domain-containing protein [Tepidisphaeraceae bacterium]
MLTTALLSTSTTVPSTLPTSPEDRFVASELIASDDFRDASQLVTELESGGTVEAKDGVLIINAPAGCTVWFKPALEGPVMIEYDATVISAGGANDRVSDLNCFWMATDARAGDDFFSKPRSGKFADYNELKCYYVGVGGNGNTTTRFRRYVGDRELRPLLPEHDLHDADDLLKPNTSYHVRIISTDKLIQFWRDDRKLFELVDLAPYVRGQFGWRTVSNHMQVRNFRMWRLKTR